MARHDEVPWNDERVKAVRGALDLSAAEMARRLGVRQRTIEAIASGRMNATDLVAIKLRRLERPVQRNPKVSAARDGVRKSVGGGVSAFLGR